jgi:hypothetical protein
MAEATGDEKFDKMIKGITGKKQVAKQQKADTKQQARDAFGSMFGGGNPANKLSIMKKESASEPTEGEMKGKQGYSRKAQIVMNASKGKKSDSPEKYQKDPELSSEIHKT